MDGFRIPIGDWAEGFLDYLRENWDFFFDLVRAPIAWFEGMLRGALLEPHILVLVAILAVIVYLLVGRRPALVVAGIGIVAWVTGAALGQWDWKAPPDWTEVYVPWSALGIDGRGVMAIMLVGGPQPGKFAYQVDDVRLR